MHQALLSAVTLARLRQDQIQILSPRYVYHLSFQTSYPISRRIKNLNELDMALYKETLGACLSGIAVGPKHRPWLAEHGIRR